MPASSALKLASVHNEVDKLHHVLNTQDKVL